MGGTSTQQQSGQQQQYQQVRQNQNSSESQYQNSTIAPWLQAQPALQGILGQLDTNLNRTGLTGAEDTALHTITRNAANANAQYTPQLTSLMDWLNSGGGANETSPMVNDAYAEYQRRLNPVANGDMIGKNSGLAPYLDTLRSDITNQVNGSFAAAGRDFSGANQQALTRGISQGLAPVIANQYNTDIASQRSAADALYGAGNTTSGILAGLNREANANRGAGAAMIPGITSMQDAEANAVLQAEAKRRGVPAEALSLLAKIGVPIASLGQQSSGSGYSQSSSDMSSNAAGIGFSNQQGRNTMSGAQQFATIAQGVNSLFGGGGSGGGTNMLRFLFS